MSLFLRGRTLDFEKVHEVRALLEVHIAGLAADRATTADLARLREVHERMEHEAGDVESAARDGAWVSARLPDETPEGSEQ